MGETPAGDRIIGVVDDDESVRMAIRSLLRSLGFQVEDVACLIVDVRLPGMSGLDLQRRLVAANRGLPMAFITAHDDPIAQRQALAAGALAFLRKPFSEESLIDAVRSALTRAGGSRGPNP